MTLRARRTRTHLAFLALQNKSREKSLARGRAGRHVILPAEDAQSPVSSRGPSEKENGLSAMRLVATRETQPCSNNRFQSCGLLASTEVNRADFLIKLSKSGRP